MPQVAEIREQLSSKGSALMAFYREHDNGQTSAEDVKTIESMKSEIDNLKTQLADGEKRESEMAEVENLIVDLERKDDLARRRPPQPSASKGFVDERQIIAVTGKSPGQLFCESPVYKAALKAGHYQGITYAVELPELTLFKAAGDPVMSSQFATRETYGGLVTQPFPPTNVIGLIPVVNVTAASIRYYQAGTFTGTAGFVTEGAVKPEVQPRWTPVDAPVETLADWTAVTLQALDDVPQLRAAVDYDLRRAIEVKLDNAILNGTGTPPEIRGILNTSGIQVIAYVATTTKQDMIAKGIQAIVQTGYGVPDAVVMNPADYWAMRTGVNANGIYYWGPPTEVGIPNVYGLPVVTDSAIAVGTALVGDFSYATLFQRRGITFIVGWKNDDIIRNLQTIVCEMRVTLAIRRPAAFAKVALV
jgi:HK97 family phage major capsid protein